jgi:hypothetical protein
MGKSSEINAVGDVLSSFHYCIVYSFKAFYVIDCMVG